MYYIMHYVMNLYGWFPPFRENLPEGVANVIKDCWKPCEEVTMGMLITFAQEMFLLRELSFSAFQNV